MVESQVIGNQGMSLQPMVSGVIAAVLLCHLAQAQGPVPQGSPIPRVLPSVPPTVAPGLAVPEPAVPENVPDRPVTVRRIIIDGNTAFSNEELQAVVAA